MAKNNHFSYDDPVWAAHRPYVEAFARMSSSCVFVALRGEGYPFLSPALGALGYDIPDEGGSAELGFLEQRIHPDDQPVFADIKQRLDSFLGGLPPEEQKDYKHIYEFRGLNREGEWLRVISQHHVLDRDTQGRILLLGTIDISPDQTPFTGFRFTLINFRTGEMVPFEVYMDTAAGLTLREREVLGLIDAGMYSREISERLCISIHTVNRHRQNILEKMNAGNTREAAGYARKLGLLPPISV